MIGIRLSERDILAMKSLFLKYFGEGNELWVFGSRADMTKKGGDIDLYIQTSIKDVPEAVKKKISFICDLKQKIGDQKIDVVLDIKNLKGDLAIYQVAKSEGVRII